MSIWRRLFGGKGATRTKTYISMGSTTRAGVNVTPEIALTVSAVLAATRIIAEGCAQVPLKLLKEEDREEQGVQRTLRLPARDHYLYNILAYRPNNWMTSYEWRETMTMHAALTGNGISIITNGVGQRVRELLPVHPDDVEITLNEKREIQYKIWLDADRWVTGGVGTVFHLRGPSWDGILGMEVYRHIREVIGLSKDMEATHSRLFSSGGRPSGVLSTKEPIGDEMVETIRQRWQERFGQNGDGGTAVLDGGWDFKPINVTATDTQYIENRKLLIEEVARAFRVFPHMLMQSDERSAYASVSEFFIAHVIHTLGPWFQRWESALKRDVIGWGQGNGNIWPKLMEAGLMRGNPTERANYFTKMITSGIYSPNECRALDDMNPREGGDEYLTPTNMRIGDDDGTQGGSAAGSQDGG